jgi:hypothetical protein
MTFRYASNVLAGGVMLSVFWAANSVLGALRQVRLLIALVLLSTTKLRLGYQGRAKASR